MHLPTDDKSPFLAVWIPTTDVGTDNAPLLVVPGSHYSTDASIGASLAPDLEMVESFESRSKLIEVKKGGALFFNNRLVHTALPNISDQKQSAFNFRYVAAGYEGGRPNMPSFLVRSRGFTEKVLHNPLD